MPTNDFYLWGEAPSTARPVELPDGASLKDLQHIVAAQFAIVEPDGVGFLAGGDKRVMVPSEILGKDTPFAVSIDDQKAREVPGPKGLPYFGNYFEVYPDHLGNHTRLFNKYGPLFVTTNMGNRVYQTNDPRLAHIIFAESDYFSKEIVPGHPLHPIKQNDAGVFLGDTHTDMWRKAHKFMPPALGPKAVKHYSPKIQKTVEDSYKVFDELDERGEAFNVFYYMLKLGSQAIGKLTMGMDFRHFDSVDAPLHEMVTNITHGLEINKRIASMGAWYGYLPFGDPKRLRQMQARLAYLMGQKIAEVTSAGKEDLELHDAALKADHMIDYFARATDGDGNKLPPSQYVHALIVATGAGYVTTSSLLSWLIYTLVHYPGIQDRLLQELADNDMSDDRELTPDWVNSLPFLRNMVKETQRRHNPSYQPARTSQIDMILPGGYKLPKGSVCIPALHHIHNNESIWDNPARFDPDRWDTDAVKNRPSSSYIPFAEGPRGCIGFNFALLEARIFLCKLVWRYNFSKAEEGAIEYDPYFQLIRPVNLYVHAERRIKWPPKAE